MRKEEKKQIVADQFAVVEIVDGQQRLTTLIILLRAIQKALNPADKDEKKLADELAQLLVKDDKHTLLLLQTNHDTSHIFADYIRDGITPNPDANTSADQNIVDAIAECERFVTDWKAMVGSLVELIRIIRHRLSAVFHVVGDERLVYRVFELLNSRGLDVASIDKFKSRLMGLIFEDGANAGRDEAIKELHLIWREIYRTIGKQQRLTTETLRFAATLRAPRDVSHKRPLDEPKSLDTLIAEAGTKPKKIIDCAKWLQAVVVAENKLLGNHRWQAVTDIVQARLVAIAILLRGFTASEQANLLGRWERVTFRIYGLARADSRSKVGDYTTLAWAITNDKLSATDIMKRLADLGQEHPIAKVIEETFDPTNSYEGWAEKLRYFLFRYEEHLARKAGQKLNESQWNKIWHDDPAKSIEHIKPQSSGVSYMHHLGNLMMLAPGVNSKLQDIEPAKKAETYLTSGFLASIEVAKLIKKGAWNKESVEARGDSLLSWARTEWGD
ncbi:MAG: DUF262 domain-containing protein [Candidatus Binataceae bacterium]|nr:DUF262 domain-containing protein [Candidatus Binataceae bacterium]